MVEDVMSPVGDEQILETVVVVVTDTHSAGPARFEQPRFLGDVCECAVAVVLIEAIARTFGSVRQANSRRDKDVEPAIVVVVQDRKSTRLNSSHVAISYAVFCSLYHLYLHSFPTRRSSDLVVVTDTHSAGPARFEQPRFLGDVCECAVAVVLIEAIARTFGSVRQANSRRDKDVEPAIVVVVQKCTAAACHLDDVVLAVNAAIDHGVT